MSRSKTKSKRHRLWWVLITKRGWLPDRCRLSNWNLALKKSSCRHTGELCSNWPKTSIAAQKINIDNKTRFCCWHRYCYRLIGISICWPATETDTQFTTFDLSALKKKYLIFFSDWLISFMLASLTWQPKNKISTKSNATLMFAVILTTIRLLLYIAVND